MEGKELKYFLIKLRQFNQKHPNWAVLVEGKRDRKALERLGIENVIDLKGRKFHDVAEYLSENFRGVVLLMDFDPEGEEIFNKLSRILKGYGLKVDGSFREELRQTGVKFVEKIVEELRRRDGI
jgi:5S rRNA maturation endonuclease (ribonuclease M5)